MEKIKFRLAESSDVSLALFDESGKKIREFINERLAAGSYDFDCDTTKIESGMYTLKLKAGTLISEKKIKLNN